MSKFENWCSLNFRKPFCSRSVSITASPSRIFYSVFIGNYPTFCHNSASFILSGFSEVVSSFGWIFSNTVCCGFLMLSFLWCLLLDLQMLVWCVCSPWGKVLLERLTIFQPVRKFPTAHIISIQSLFIPVYSPILSWRTIWYCPPIYSCTFQVVSFSQISTPKLCMHLFFPFWVPHAPPILFFSLWSPK
jgi:hypothetical protein